MKQPEAQISVCLPESRPVASREAHPDSRAADATVNKGLPTFTDDVAPRKVAILVCHGMGQQVPFENIDLVASALVERDVHPRADGGCEALPPTSRVRFVQLGTQRLARAEVTLSGKRPTVAHVYEAYWAPLTEGRVGAMYVTLFLLQAAFRGFQYTLRGSFDRWVFGGMRKFSFQRRTILWLAIAFLVVLAGLLAYTALAYVVLVKVLGFFVAERALGLPASTLAPRLTLRLFESPLILSLLLIAWGIWKWSARFAAPAVSWMKPDWLRGVIPRLVAAGVLVWVGFRLAWVQPALREAFHAARRGIFPPALSPASVWMALGAMAAASLVAVFLYTAGLRGATRWKMVAGGFVAAFGATVVGAWLMASASLMVWDTARWLAGAPLAAAGGSVAPHPALLAVFLVTSVIACWQLRSLYIQYMGDVAIYLSSHQLNEFAELREQIKKVGAETGCVVYGARNATDTGWEYDEVIVAGHSLGSVVAYDTLNAVLNDDRILPIKIGAEARTRALVTFGSPLDKSAFFFRTQLGKARFREALAASAQPLIEPLDADGNLVPRSIRWINIHSPFDPISGPVNFYDPPKGETAAPGVPAGTRVRNRRDRHGVLFGAAHTHYWKNPTLVNTLYHLATVPRRRDS
jgi:hypothetical protein